LIIARNSNMRIAIAGASGRMGHMLVEAVLNAPDMELAVALARAGSAAVGQDAGAFLGRETGVIVTDNVDAIAGADCLIDFTRPEGTLRHLDACVKHGVKMVVGTTGFDENGRAAIDVAAQKIAIVFAPNMSVGVNATLKLLDVAARILNSGYDVEVFEAHHRNKVDAPSGTALKMGETVASAWGVALPDVVTWARHGETGARKPGTIGFSVLRGGDIVGDHTVYFCGTGERIEITHRSSSRATYAEGSVRAAAFLHDKTNGVYDMQAVLGL
jgi:4-hydroxy-tetrahydrodipicolinate reductase